MICMYSNIRFLLVLGLASAGTVSACRSSQDVLPSQQPEAFQLSTADATLLATVQADTALTAEWVGTIQAESASPTPPLPTAVNADVDATPLAQLTGQCSVPEGYTLNTRGSFCVAAPSSWTALNFDGGLAAALNTTPGQALTLEPDWAEDSTVCQLTMYVVTGVTAIDHINQRYAEFRSRQSIETLSAVEGTALGDLAVTGFTWSGIEGSEAGGVYAGEFSNSQVLHIGYSGTQCPVEDLFPVVNTLRFQ